MVKASGKIEELKYPTIIIGASILLAFFLGFVVIRPLYNKMTIARGELKSKKEVLKALETKLETLKGLKEKEAELKEKNEKVLAALPKDKDVPRLFTQFENLAGQSGLAVTRVAEVTSTAPAASSDVIKAINYQVAANGHNYDSLKSALVKSEQALRLLSITDMNVNVASGNFDIIFNIVSFVRAE